MNQYKIKNKNTAIMRFNNEYFFLSNFYEGEIFTYKGCKFTNAEAPFHAEKCISRIKDFEMERPSQSKKLGRRVALRGDWEDVKDEIMYDICYAKFTQDEKLKARLLATGDRELIEGNNHRDKCWGMTFEGGVWVGENRLGIVLMKLRKDLMVK